MNPRAYLIGTLTLTVAILIIGCAKESRTSTETPPVKVSVAEVKEDPVLDYEEFTGRTAPVKTVDIKARATGYLDKVMFKDGDFIKEGQQLYQIDERTYQAEVKNIKGTIARMQAAVTRADSELERTRRLLVGSAVSREEYEKAVAQKDEARASLEVNEANLEKANLNLSFCKVMAPISGIISRTKITEGNLVTADQTSLTTLVSVDPMYAYFDVDELSVLRIQQMVREEISAEGVAKADAFLQKNGVDEATVKKITAILAEKVTDPLLGQIHEMLKVKLDAKGLASFDQIIKENPKFHSYRDTKVPVFLATQIDKGYPHEGFIDFVDNRLAATTGTLRVRGNFPNPGRVLSPNLFVRIRLPIGDPYNAVLVSDTAVVTSQDRKFLYVVGADNTIEANPVRLGPIRDGLRVIESGVKPGDRVVVSGIQRVQPGSKVEPTLLDKMPGAPNERAPAVPPAIKEKKN